MKKLCVAAVVVLAACSSSKSSTSTSTTIPPPTTAAAIASPLHVLAAASLTGPFNSSGPKGVTFDFAGSNALAAQIIAGAPADVFASADMANMNKVLSYVETPVVFARNKLEIAVAPGNPKHIASLTDLARSDVSSVLEAAGVPAGDYTRSVETKLGITIKPKSLEPDVKTAITQVTTGEVDATVVYVTDVAAAGSKVAGVAIDDSLQPSITYPIAVLKSSKYQADAQAYVTSAVSGDVQKALEAAGFLAP
jgi:molybdate transport system substrate-binding protein